VAAYDTDNPELGSISIRLPNAGPVVHSDPNVVAAIADAPPAQQTPLQALALTIQQLAATQRLVSDGITFSRFLEYEYADDYLTPADGWHFTLDDDELTESDRYALQPGTRVEVTIDDQVQSIGYIHKVRSSGGRGRGSVVLVEGRDWLARAVDAHIDPRTTRFTASQSMLDVLNQVLGPFGMTATTTDATQNRNAITGQIYGTPTTKKGKPLKNYVSGLPSKPHPQEGAFQFASRIAQRFGLWLRPAVDGQTLIVTSPDFSQPSRYQILHSLDPSISPHNNVEDYEVEKSDQDQPSIIFAGGSGGGGTFATSQLKGAIVNPMVVVPVDETQRLLAPYPELVPVLAPIPAIAAGLAAGPMPNPNATPLYLYDPESHTQDELSAFLRRELALRMRKSFTARYTIEGHRLGGQPIAVDSIVAVEDDRANVHTNLWILGRHFSKSVGGGTRTTMECLLPGSMAF
jgi:prophage tail gpP-like protein